MPDSQPLHIEGLGHSYDASPVFDAVSLSVHPGELVAVLGASGSGKSTLLRAVAGFIVPTTGSIQLGGTLVTAHGVEHVSAEKRRVGMVFQDYALFEHMTIAENVRFGIHREPERDRRVSELLDLVGLGGFENRYPNSLSGGQQQRVALIRALAPGPSLLVLDEPFANLDGALLRDIGRELKHVLNNQGVSALLVTHDRSEALGLADRVAILDGEAPATLVQTGSPEQVYAVPATVGAARLTGPLSLVDGTGQGESAHTPIGEISLHERREGACKLVLRPEQITIAPSGGNTTVVNRRFAGSHYELELNSPAGELLAHVEPSLAPGIGDRVGVAIRGCCAAVD